MSDQNSFDTRLAAHFEREHRFVPADSFVAATMQKVRAERRRSGVMRTGLRVVMLLAAVGISPWLITGVARLNAALEFSLTWIMALPGAWALGPLVAIVALAVLATRVRSR